MTVGLWRDGFPRLTSTLPGLSGPQDVEFIIDTGFDGEVALPEALVRGLELELLETRFVQLADGFRQRRCSDEMLLDWDDKTKRVEVLTLDGNPLLGNRLWQDTLLHAENRDGGEVLFEPL